MKSAIVPASLFVSAILAGCANTGAGTQGLNVNTPGKIVNEVFGGTHPSTGPVVPDGVVQLSTHNVYSVETLAVGAVAIGLIYVIYDPLAPNWKVEEKALNVDTYALSLRAKSFRTGGDGEAMMILKRRALKLQREKGFTGYRILDYSEGVESSTPFTHRFSEATIQLVRADVAPKKP